MTLRQFIKRRLVKRQLVNRHLVKYDNWSSTSIGQVEKECVDSSSRNKNLVIIENEWEGGRVSIKSINDWNKEIYFKLIPTHEKMRKS